MIYPYETILRLIIGATLGGIIGFERQSHGRPAGFRTHLLVSLASVLIMIVSLDFYEAASVNPDLIRIDPARIAAGAITGIGFLGAGVIIKSGLTIQGLTTAACIWVVSAIGLAVGSGLYIPATVTFIITFIALWVLRNVEAKLPRLRYKNLTIITESAAADQEILELIDLHGVEISSLDHDVDKTKNEKTLHITLTYKNADVLKDIMAGLSEDPAVRRYSLRG